MRIVYATCTKHARDDANTNYFEKFFGSHLIYLFFILYYLRVSMTEWYKPVYSKLNQVDMEKPDDRY